MEKRVQSSIDRFFCIFFRKKKKKNNKFPFLNIIFPLITPLFASIHSPPFSLSLSLHLFPPSFISPVPVQLAPFCTQPSTRNLIHLVDLARILVERHAYHATYFFSLVHFDSRLDILKKSSKYRVQQRVKRPLPVFFYPPLPLLPSLLSVLRVHTREMCLQGGCII